MNMECEINDWVEGDNGDESPVLRPGLPALDNGYSGVAGIIKEVRRSGVLIEAFSGDEDYILMSQVMTPARGSALDKAVPGGEASVVVTKRNLARWQAVVGRSDSLHVGDVLIMDGGKVIERRRRYLPEAVRA